MRVSARMFSLRGYRTDPDMDADVWRRSEVLRDLNQYTLSLHEHGERLGLAPLTSRDARVGQCSLGTLFATILRDECRADVCLYNSGGIRGNAEYGLGTTHVRRSRRRGALREQHHHPGDDRG